MGVQAIGSQMSSNNTASAGAASSQKGSNVESSPKGNNFTPAQMKSIKGITQENPDEVSYDFK